MAHLTPLNFCGKCHDPFNPDAMQIIGDMQPVNPEDNIQSLIVTPCYHIFHQSCLGRWIREPQGTCPTCRGVIYQHQAGKEPSVYLKIFVEALQKDPDIVSEIFENSDHANNECSSYCLENLPFIALRYDSAQRRFFHQDCAPIDEFFTYSFVTLQELTQVVSKVVQRHPHLVPQFTPTPPVNVEQIDHSRFYTAVITLGMISLYLALRRS